MRWFSKTAENMEWPARFGHPGPCPRCSGVGWLTNLDLEARMSEHRCLECGLAWTSYERRRGESEARPPEFRVPESTPY